MCVLPPWTLCGRPSQPNKIYKNQLAGSLQALLASSQSFSCGGYMRFCRLVLLVAFVSSITVWAQLTVSTLRGTATDPAGAVVANAHITAINQETNLTREV